MPRKIIIVTGLFSIIFFSPQGLASQAPISFLQANQAQLTVKDDCSGLNLLNSSLQDNQVFLTGEMHGVAVNAELELKFLKYFQQKTGLNYYLIEGSYAKAQLLNKYLTTGREKILAKIMEGGFEHEYLKWKKIYKFNQSLPKKEKIKVVGIDVVTDYRRAIWYLSTLLPEKEPPKKLQPIVKKLRTMQKTGVYFKASLKNWAKKVKVGIKSNYKLYADYFGDKLFDLKIITDNILNKFKVDEAFKKFKFTNSTKLFNKIRDALMYSNFKKIYNHLDGGKYYGQFGLGHALQRATGGVNWLGTRLNSDSNSPVQDKVLSIVYLYKDCAYWGARWEEKSELKRGLTTYKYSPLDKSTTSKLTLFKLTGANSPFAAGLPINLQNIPGAIPQTGTTIDYYQSVVVIKNGEAGKLLKNNN